MTPQNSKTWQLPARRRADLLDFIRQHGQATVTELAETFGVSSDTVRRDLDHLADLGTITRTHGGAVPAEDLATSDNPFLTRLGAQSAAKERIAAAAAGLVGDGQTVIVNGGTTTLALAGHLAERRDLTIVTNNLLLPPALPDGIAKDVYVVGGACRMRALVTIGRVRFPDAEGATSLAISADLAVIGVGGVSPTGAVSTSDLREAQMMREMMGAAKRVVVLADSSKFERTAFARICGPEEFDVLVTDAELAPTAADALAAAGVEVVVA